MAAKAMAQGIAMYQEKNESGTLILPSK